MSLRSLLALFFALLLLLAMTAGVFLFQAIESQPRVAAPAAATPSSAEQARALLKRLNVKAKASPRFDFHASARELEAIPVLLARAWPRLSSRIAPTSAGVLGEASLALPGPLSGRYLNLSVQFTPGPVRITGLRVGTLAIPDAAANWLLETLIHALIGKESAEYFLRHSRLLESGPEGLNLHLAPGGAPKKKLHGLLTRLRSLLGPTLPEQALIERYYIRLTEIGSRFEPSRWVSLTRFIAPLFREAAREARDGTLTEHNRAAILALALYLGGEHFRPLTGVGTADLGSARPHYRTLLRGRSDLALHFVYSAALHVLAEEGISLALGELKELLDANPGGSGFSFADLAADRAGSMFAVHATGSEETAARLRDALERPLRETDLLFDVRQLPEGLDTDAFAAEYRNVASPRYQALVTLIDERLSQSRLYARSNEEK